LVAVHTQFVVGAIFVRATRQISRIQVCWATEVTTTPKIFATSLPINSISNHYPENSKR
jgi:hypothetical protein